MQFDVAEELEVEEEDREYGNFDSFDEDGDGVSGDGEGYQVHTSDATAPLSY